MGKKAPIFYNALLLTGVNLLLRLVGTGFQVYLSGKIGPAGIGLLQLVLSVGALASTAGIAGIRTATMYLTADELGRKNSAGVTWVLSGCMTYSILCSSVIAILLYQLAPWLANYWIADSSAVPALRTLAAFLPTCCLCGVMTGYFTAANRIGTLAAVEVTEQFCTMAVTVAALTFWVGTDSGRACQAVILGSGAGGCLTLICLVLLRLKEHAGTGPRLPMARRLSQTAVPLAVADVVKSGISTTENLMVPKRLSKYPGEAAPLAAFGTVCGMVFPIMMFPAAILFGLCELLIPELARCASAGSHRRIAYLSRQSLRVGLVYGCLFSGLLFLLAEPLCMALYQSAEAGKYLRLYAILVPMLYCDCLTDAMTKGLGQQKACVRYNILTSALDVVLLFLLLPRYGMMGYFFSFLVTHVLNFLLSLRRLLKITKHRPSFRRPAVCILSAVVSVLAATFVAQPIIKAAAYVLLLGCLLFLLRVLDRSDIRWLKGLVCKK